MSDKYVKLTWNEHGKHEIEIVGITRPLELRRLLEHGLKHIRMCLFRGKPLGHVSQMKLIDTPAEEVVDVHTS